MGLFAHTLIINMPGLNARGLQSKLLITPLYTGADPGLTVGGGAKYTARVSAREILYATPTFDVISAHDMLYEEKVNK